METSKEKNEVSYSLLIDRELHTRLKVKCATERISIKNYINALIMYDLENKVFDTNNIQK